MAHLATLPQMSRWPDRQTISSQKKRKPFSAPIETWVDARDDHRSGVPESTSTSSFVSLSEPESKICKKTNMDRGAHRYFLKGGVWNFEKNILLSLKCRLPYLLQHSCHICYFSFNTSTLFLTRSSRDVCFLCPSFPDTVILLIC